MAGLFPFRALRPVPAVAKEVAAVPYDVVTREEASELARDNPLSFLHVSRAEIDCPDSADPYGPQVYEQAAANLRSLTARAPLVLEDRPALYVYRLEVGGHRQTGLAGCFSVDEYESGVIKKHERTRRDKEDDRTRHMLAIRAQTGPVFLTYVAPSRVAAGVDRAADRAPLFDFVAEDSVRHTIWRMAEEDARTVVEAFGDVAALYIADGHHRAASAARARAELRRTAGAGGWDRFLGVAFPHDQVRILAYNRLIRDLGPWSPASLLARLRESFAVGPGPARPVRAGDVSIRLGERWYTMSLSSTPGQLDVDRLQDAVVGPLLGVTDVRTDPRIEFVGGARGTDALEQAVATGRAAVAFSLFPVAIADLMAISDAGGVMPPKSTWFEPKLRDGLLSHVF